MQVTHLVRPDGSDAFFITDPNRLGPLLILLLLFVAFTVAVSRWKGVRSLVGMGISLYVITQFILPMILAGYSPFLVTILGAFALLSITQYLIYGWSLKTHAAVLGILISLIITGVLATIFVEATRLTGYGSEEVGFLQTAGVPIDPRGLLLAGILIGALGVLDDITISQASAVFELSAANFNFGVRESLSARDEHRARSHCLHGEYPGAGLRRSLAAFTLIVRDLSTTFRPVAQSRIYHRRNRAHAGGQPGPGGRRAHHHGAGLRVDGPLRENDTG